MSEERRFLSVKETAEMLGLDANTVYRMTSNGLLPSTRIGTTVRVERSELEDFLQRNTRRFTPAAV